MSNLSKAQVYATLAQATAAAADACATAKYIGYLDDLRDLIPKTAEYVRLAEKALAEESPKA